MKDHSFYARTCNGMSDPSGWQLLEDHLLRTAELAAGFCKGHPWTKWAYLAGLWHDIGKYSDDFQKRLAGSGRRIVHSTAGAREAERVFSDSSVCEQYIARILGFVIAGHHAGLPDGLSPDDSCLTKRLRTDMTDYSEYPGTTPENTSLEIHDIDEICADRANIRETAFGLNFFIRMLFSCLVDADRLDSEAFADPETHAVRGHYPAIEDLNNKLAAHLEMLSHANPEKPVNRIRTRVLSECRAAADETPGVFSLTVPTGGGKTLSSLAFALSHALRHGLERVIYVIPYTSIIEQNADVFRACLGKESVVEHHSNYDIGDEAEDLPRRLATDNWDAPLIVTTNVQFFESLFSHHPSRCRKLHNIMHSVVILDEAQMLPPELLIPCVGALRELSGRYGTTVLLCTATQPTLGAKDGFKRGFERVREIITDRECLYEDLKRVTVTGLGKTPESDIVNRVMSHSQALCIVNTKARAKRFYESLGELDGSFHLSASMCPAHRSERIDEIKRRLDGNEPCRVVSTQLIETGVDVDFPVVYREIAGLDSLIQAAGRCNREGRLPRRGKVFVFEPEEGETHLFRQQTQAARGVMRNHEDIISLEAIREYFRELYWKKGDEALDSKHIYRQLGNTLGRSIDFPFREIGELFRLIEDGTRPVVIPWGTKGKALVCELREQEPDKNFMRKLQRYTVNVYSASLGALERAGAVETVHNRFHVLENKDIYSEETGLTLDNPYYREPESLIV